MRFINIAVVAALVLCMLVQAPLVFAEGQYDAKNTREAKRNVSGEDMVADLVFARPIGFLGLVFGTAAFAKHIADHIFHYTGFTFFDVGTTTFHLASHLSTENRVGPSLSVLTNSLFVHPFLAHRGVNIKLIGGTVNRLRSYIVKSNAYDIARERFNDQQLQYSFISIDGISLEKSFSSDPILSDDKHQAILATKDTIIFVADHSKIGNPEGREFTSLDE